MACAIESQLPAAKQGIRKDQAEEAKDRLRALIEEALASGPALPLTRADEDELLAIARGEID